MVHTAKTHPHAGDDAVEHGDQTGDSTVHTRVVDEINVAVEIEAHRPELHSVRLQQAQGLLSQGKTTASWSSRGKEGNRCTQQPTASRSSRTFGHSCKLCQPACKYRSPRESYAPTEKAKDRLPKPGKKRTEKSSTTKLTPQPDKLQGQICSLENGSFHRRSIRQKSAVANLRLL